MGFFGLLQIALRALRDEKPRRRENFRRGAGFGPLRGVRRQKLPDSPLRRYGRAERKDERGDGRRVGEVVGRGHRVCGRNVERAFRRRKAAVRAVRLAALLQRRRPGVRAYFQNRQADAPVPVLDRLFGERAKGSAWQVGVRCLYLRREIHTLLSGREVRREAEGAHRPHKGFFGLSRPGSCSPKIRTFSPTA